MISGEEDEQALKSEDLEEAVGEKRDLMKIDTATYTCRSGPCPRRNGASSTADRKHMGGYLSMMVWIP